MRFTSLIVELIRARPRLVFWIVVLVQAMIWLLLPMVFYGSPPGEVASVLARGREYQVGSADGPPLAFWFADIAFRGAGNHIVGVYLLAQLCFIATFWALYQLGRAVVGGPHAMLAVLLTMTVTVFSSPGVEFGPQVLARPLWALVLLHGWRIIGQGRRSAWFGLSIAAGLLLLTTTAAAGLLALLACFALATARGRRQVASFDPFYAVLVVAMLALPYLIWLVRADALPAPQWPALDRLDVKAMLAAERFGWLALASAGVAMLTLMNSRRLMTDRDDAPLVFRAPMDDLARRYVYFFAAAPVIAGCVIAGLYEYDGVAGGAGIALLLCGLAVVVAAGDSIALRRQQILRKAWAAAIAAPAVVAIAIVLVQPWIGGAENPVSLPSAAMARFFGESFERRTGRPLTAVAGDSRLASLIAMGPTRPHVVRDNAASLERSGGVVVWRASDTVGAPPADIAARFPGLAHEVPRAFDRLVNGREPPVRIGWAIVRPKTTP